MGKPSKSARTANPTKTHLDINGSAGVDRRNFLSTALAGLGGLTLASGCSSEATSSAGAPPIKNIPFAVPASDAPEVADLKVGIIALTDCSPLVVGAEKGFFKKYGLNVTIAKQASWAAIRDALSTGDIQATHMLLGMPLASSLGLLGSPKKPMVAPWILNRNGQAITLKAGLKGKVAADPKALKPLVDEAKAAGTPMTFAVTFPPGTHAMWMRYYLAAGGINPDSDVALVTIPPPQMVANMKVDKMDGYCVGEPWNARAIADGIGFTSITTQEIWKDHPEKVCAFTGEFAEKNPKTVKAMLKGLHDASVWLDDMTNRPEQCEIVSRANYINCPADIILGRMQGKYDYGDGRVTQDPNYMIFHDRNCNYPQLKYAKWFLSQYRRWGMVDASIDYDVVAQQVMRPDLYEEAMKEIGYKHGGPDVKPETLFDGITFDPAKPEDYAKSFAVHSMKDA
jgi:nitrate/nitrite transport system substrate-binding protein